MIHYCQRIAEYLTRYDNSYTAFESDAMFQDACCMCVVQIGELSGLLSDELKSRAISIPWRVIKDTRNFYVHAYGSIDFPSVWETLNEDIPVLAMACKKLLEE